MKNRAPTAIGQCPVLGGVETRHGASLQGLRTHGMCTSYFPSLNFLYPLYLSFANCSVLAKSSLASAGLFAVEVTSSSVPTSFSTSPSGGSHW